MRVAIISSCYGDYDTPRPPVAQETDHDVEYVMVTDDASGWDGWDCRVERRPHVHPNVAAKHAKFMPLLYVDADVTVWVDAGTEIGHGLAEAAAEHASENPYWWGMFPHPHRTRLADEVAVSRTLRKYDALDLETQIATYIGDGYPDDALWATGCIVRPRTANCLEFGAGWLAEIVRWGFQDQLSFAYLAWLRELTVTAFGPSLFTSPHVRFADHTMKP